MLPLPRMTISGARGVVGEDLTAAGVLRLAQAFGSIAGPGRIALGRDARISGPMFRHAAIAGLQASGCEAADLGLAPTPTVGLYTRETGAAGAIQITASHNPQPYNGLKFYTGDGGFVPPETIERIKEVFYQDTLPHIGTEVGATVPDVCDVSSEALEMHLQCCLQHVDRQSIAARELKVVVDGCHSVGGSYIPELLKRLGCTVFEIACQPDGLFDRGLEPIPENLEALSESVRSHEADLGIAVDPDADRVAFVDEAGTPIGEESGLALAIEHVLQRGETGTVAINSCTTQQVEAVAHKYNVEVLRTAVGELNVVEGMRETGATIGGEGNGGVIYPAIHRGRDALAGAALVVEALAKRKFSLSAWRAQLPPSHILKDKVQFSTPPPEDWKERLRGLVPEAKLNDTDGLRFVGAGWWLSIRLSNTEPILRLIAEAESLERAAQLVESAKQAIAEKLA